MTQVESMQTIVKRFRSEGKNIREAQAEWTRQGREAVREQEDNILANKDAYPAEIVEQIEDHRAAGNYTTQG
jgi:hypothetical protein